MLYAFRTTGQTRTLVETTRKELATSPDLRRTTAEQARAWVARHGLHETGLYRDHMGRIRYARATA